MRIRFGFWQREAAVAIVLATAACRSGVSKPAGAGGSAMFRAGPHHAGVGAGQADGHFGGLLWQVQTGGPVRSTPAVVGGALYVGSSDGNLYALDASTGRERWRFDASSPITSSPAVADGRVYFAARDGTIYGLDQQHGTLIWRMRTGADVPLAWGHESGDLYESSPTIVGSWLFVGSGDGRVYALDVSTGGVRWTYQTGGRVRSSPAVADGVVYVGSMDGSVYALAAGTGHLTWRYDTEGHGLNSGKFGYDRRTVQSSPAVLGDLVIVGARDGFLYGIDRAMGALRWRVNHEISWVNGSPAVEEGAVYSGTSDGHFFQRVDPRTGKQVWRDSSAGISFSSPEVVGGSVYAVDASGTLYVRDKRTGTEHWRYTVGWQTYSSPVVVDNVVYFGNDDGRVYAVRLTSESALRRAVFWDSSLVKASDFRSHHRVRDFLAERGYTVLDASHLTGFLETQLQDHAPSVVVFAIDYLPRSVAPIVSDTVLFRRYLNAGGKVIWLGPPPFLWPLDPKTGEFESLNDVKWNAPKQLLGVEAGIGTFHPHYRAEPTAAGRRWGLNRWWLSLWGADPATVTSALAMDENGLAAAWVRSFGGPPGTGFVQLYGGWGDDLATPVDLHTIQAAAEYMPAGDVTR